MAVANCGCRDVSTLTPEIKAMLDETKVCLTCGTKLKYLDKNKRRNRGYCSLVCYFAKPPHMAYAERVYGKPIRQVILDLLNKNNNITATAQLLGVRKGTMFAWIRRLGIRRKVLWE